MRRDKRWWIYSGVAMPQGVALARSAPGALAPTGSVLLCGSDLAVGIAPPLRRLCRDAGVPFHCHVRPGTTADTWRQRGWLMQAVREHHPRHVVVGIGDTPLMFPGAAAQLAEEVAREGALALWLCLTRPGEGPGAPGYRYAVAPAVADGHRASTAFGYAGWAATVWREIFGRT